jgi:hypothetical protein
MKYLSDYKKYPKKYGTQVGSGSEIIDSFWVDYAANANYRKVLYIVTVENTDTNSVYTSRLSVTHDGLTVSLTEYDVDNNGDLDLDFEATFVGDDGNGHPTRINLNVTFPANFDGTWTLLREELFINTSDIRKTGTDGPSEWLTPSPYLYPV